MTEQTKVWKAANNRVDIIGVVAQNNLEIKEMPVYENGKPTGETITACLGDLVIRTADNENHTVRLRQNAITKAKAPNKMYPGLVTIMNEVVSIADLEKNPEATPTRLSIVGEIVLNEFAGHDLEIRSTQQIRGVFVNRLD